MNRPQTPLPPLEGGDCLASLQAQWTPEIGCVVELATGAELDRALLVAWLPRWLDPYREQLRARHELDNPASYFALCIGFAQTIGETVPGAVFTGGPSSNGLGPTVTRAGFGYTPEREDDAPHLDVLIDALMRELTGGEGSAGPPAAH